LAMVPTREAVESDISENGHMRSPTGFISGS
jgi:hypothetical protein